MANTDKIYMDGEYVGTVKFVWEVPEFQDYTRGKRWYLTAAIIGLLLLVYAVYTANLLFGMIIIIAAVTLVKIDKSKPGNLQFAITTKGIVLGDKYYEYGDVHSFYIVYDPPEVSNLFIEFNNVLRPRINIPLFDQDPIELRKYLKKYINEDIDREGEPISEAIGKILKL
ncbi:MAG: hypothetical protein ACKKL6_00695 [Candidatus Komeilibacteria bacterium]